MAPRISNPNGIVSSSPGLRGTSYPGESETINTTLKGLRQHAMRTTEMAATPLGLWIVGGEAQTEANGIERITKGVRIENYLQNGATNLTATAPDCFVDPKSRTAYSASHLQVLTARGQLAIQGQGFFYQQTNFNLIISNQIETTVHRELIRSTNALASPLLFRTRTNAPAGSNGLIKIFSESFSLESSSNLALYTGSVRVDDPQMEMACEILTLRRSTNGPIERIEAERNVAITNKQDQSY